MPVKTSFLHSLFTCLSFLLTTGCVSMDPGPPPSPEQPPPLQLGICQPGALWQRKNFDFVQSPSSYERRSWSSALEAYHKPELLNDLGILWCRVDFSWKNMQPEQDEWYFRSMDEYLGALREQGKKVLAILAYDVPWRYEETDSRRNIQPEELHHYLNYVRKISERYGDTISGFEVWNEPNFHRFWTGSDQDFFHLTRETIKVLNETAPDVPVAVGALSYHPVTGGRRFLKDMIDSGALDGADALSLHPYGASLEATARRVKGAQEILNQNGLTHQIWITELGFPTTGLYPHRTSLEDHGAQTAKTLVLMAASGADLMTWYKLFDAYTPHNRPFYIPSESSFGLVYPDYTRKPGAYSFGILSQYLQGSHFDPGVIEPQGRNSSGIRAFGFRRGAEEIAIVLWAKNQDKSFSITLEGLKNYKVQELSGEDGPIVSGTGKTSVPVTGTPLLLSGMLSEGYDTILMY